MSKNAVASLFPSVSIIISYSAAIGLVAAKEAKKGRQSLNEG
jgi:hypothetical protein